MSPFFESCSHSYLRQNEDLTITCMGCGAEVSNKPRRPRIKESWVRGIVREELKKILKELEKGIRG